MSAHPAPPVPIRMLEPQLVAPDTHVIRQLAGEGMAPVAVPMNSMVITGQEPVIVDTSCAVVRDEWMETVFSIVDPKDVKWVYLSHDDHDHVGNLLQVLDACPDATVVTTWFMQERWMAEYGLQVPLTRMRWINDGESFHAGDRDFVAKMPPIFDSPTTRGLFDTKTGVYWAADAFANTVTHEVSDIEELDPGFWREAFSGTNRMVSPWHQFLDPVKYGAHIDSFRRMAPSVVASSHGVTLHDDQVESALKLFEELPHLPPEPLMGQVDLDAIVAQLAAQAPADVTEEAA